jgi:ABC-type sugar transport system substrate-binding protein
MKKFLSMAVVAAALVAACGGGGATTSPQASAGSQAAPSQGGGSPAGSQADNCPTPGGGGLVGIAMPTKSSARWIADGDNLVKSLKDLGYETDLQYAEDDIPTQLNQVENMITKGAKVLVIASIDGTTLTDTLQKAADACIKVFAYDRLIRNSPNVDYYAAFDNYKVGVAQAQSIIDSLQLNSAAVQHRTVRGIAGRQQRRLLLPRRLGHSQALHRQRQARREVRRDGVPEPDRHPPLER